ncbi:MAG: TonB-dependent receptor [Bacteroidales bacterium]|nr:TonB-dependent receptor [Bacteroidales bacterium]
MKRKTFIGLFLLLAICHSAYAQRYIEGTIRNDKQEVLSGVAIVVKEIKGFGTTTDEQGHYKLRLPDSKAYTLNISYYGFEKQTYSLNAGEKGIIDFTLKEDVTKLNMVVITGTRTPKLLKDAPIVTRVITQDDIEQQDATDIRDVLQTELPGVEFSYVMNQSPSLNLTGFGGNAVLFLVDGERLAGETMDNVDYSRLSMDNVGRIEIVKGAASSLYGSNAVGGVVNIISKESKDKWNANLNAHIGSHKEYRCGGSVGFNIKGFNNSTNIQYTSAAPIELQGDGLNKIYGSHSWNFKERFSYSYNDIFKITAKAGYFFRERESAEVAHERYRDFSGGLKGEYNISKNDDIMLAYTFDQYDKSDYSLQQKLDIRDYSNVQHILRTMYNHTFRQKHILTLGGDYMRDYLMSYQFTDNKAYIQHSADVFSQFDWNPSKHWNLIAGLRYDFFSATKLHYVSPKLGVMFKINDWSIRTSYSAGFRAPSLKEMFMDFDMASVFMIYGNADLKPEKSHNFSIAGEYTHKYYNVTAMGFYNLVSNRITTAWNAARKGMEYVNMAPLQIAGADISASAAWDFGLSIRVSYIYTYEYIQKGQPLTSSTRPHTATTRIAYTKNCKDHRFNVALNGRFLSKVTSDEYTSLTDYTQTEKVTYPGYTIWNLSFQYTWNAISVNTTINNLFNYVPKYYYSNSPFTTGTTFSVGLSLNIEKFFTQK